MQTQSAKQRYQRATRIAKIATAERNIQQPDYEWLKIKHQKKMMLRSIAIMAKSFDSLYTNLTGESPWN